MATISFPYTSKDKGSGGNASGYSPESATSHSTASSTQVGSVGSLTVEELQEGEIEPLQEGLPEAISKKIYRSTEETCAEEQLVEDLREHGLLDSHKFIGLDKKGRAYFLEMATRFHEEAVDEIDSQILSQSVDSDGDDDSLQLLTRCAYPINILRFRKYPDLAIYGSERIVKGRGKTKVKMSRVERFDLPNPVNPNVIIEFSWSNKLDQEISKLNLQMTDHEPSLGLVNVGYLIKAIPAKGKFCPTERDFSIPVCGFDVYVARRDNPIPVNSEPAFKYRVQNEQHVGYDKEKDASIEIAGVDLGRSSSDPGVRISLSSIRDQLVGRCGLTFQPEE